MELELTKYVTPERLRALADAISELKAFDDYVSYADAVRQRGAGPELEILMPWLRESGVRSMAVRDVMGCVLNDQRDLLVSIARNKLVCRVMVARDALRGEEQPDAGQVEA